MKLENKVLSIVNEEINLFETDITGHAFTQIKKRLGEMTSGGDITSEEDARIRNSLNLILSNEFDSKSYGIFLGAFKPNPNSKLYTTTNKHDPGIPFYEIFGDDGIFAKDSTGDEMWAIVRDNEIKTVMLRKNLQRRSMNKGRNDDGGLGVDEVILDMKSYLENKKKKEEEQKQKIQQKEKENQRIINVDGVLWVMDADTERLYKKNNPSVFVSFNNIENHPAWDEKTQDIVLNRVIEYLDSLK